MRYFREKLNRRNVTVDVKHYEDCEQFFMSVGRCFVVEALLEFFHMSDTQQKPKKNGPNLAFITTDEQKKLFIKGHWTNFLNSMFLSRMIKHLELIAYVITLSIW